MKLESGLRLGRLTLIEKTRKGGNGRRSYWLCRCFCGSEKEIDNNSLLSGSSRSCGCLRDELRPTYKRKHGDANKAPEYRIWNHMRDRCHNPNCKSYRFYGAAGIYVCERWRNSYSNFISDMGRRPSAEHEIDRIDSFGPYSPDNCRWLPRKLQARNTRRNRHVTYRGETATLAEWAERTGISAGTIAFRLKHGWPVDKALTVSPLLYHHRSTEVA